MHHSATLLIWLAYLACSAALQAAGDPERGAYIATAGGCVSCHTDSENDGAPFAGGHALETPYGVFYTPNITPDEDTGIGGWSAAQFLAAMREGYGPAGYYYPSFPYPSYAGMTEQDVLDLKAYLDALTPVIRRNEEHDLHWYVPGRWAMGIWQWLFAPWEYSSVEDPDPQLARGAYLVRHLGHCGECHTKRNVFGALEVAHELAGSPKDATGSSAPGLTRDKKTGLGKWTRGDLNFFFELGMKPDGDFVGGTMAPVVDDNTSQLTPADREAITAFLRSLPSTAETPWPQAVNNQDK